ncbi:hypothetical protein [Corallococcus llansteffanensis]|uniref:Uncharacterized protein n=1 Tax=Corallococcus llansteffanensis TaxID=2316731 RepID=A0A3A8Q2I2_9BACT|nr:hypothetical protein [Corallococcus llansteffanensis]RKH59062.1 hypothetical protein D7V93_15685 [Corallococcus llansteffanensis]
MPSESPTGATPPPRVRRALALGLIGAVVAGMALALLVIFWGPRRPSPEDLAREARIQVLALCDAVQSYRDEHGDYVPIAPFPVPVPKGRESVPFPHDHEDFHRIGFEPGPAVHFQYEVAVQESPVGEPEVSCLARVDADGDGLNAVYRIRLDANGMTSAVEAEHEGE